MEKETLFGGAQSGRHNIPQKQSLFIGILSNQHHFYVSSAFKVSKVLVGIPLSPGFEVLPAKEPRTGQVDCYTYIGFILSADKEVLTQSP